MNDEALLLAVRDVLYNARHYRYEVWHGCWIACEAARDDKTFIYWLRHVLFGYTRLGRGGGYAYSTCDAPVVPLRQFLLAVLVDHGEEVCA